MEASFGVQGRMHLVEQYVANSPLATQALTSHTWCRGWALSPQHTSSPSLRTHVHTAHLGSVSHCSGPGKQVHFSLKNSRKAQTEREDCIAPSTAALGEVSVLRAPPTSPQPTRPRESGLPHTNSKRKKHTHPWD